jgi:hypothetical protein
MEEIEQSNTDVSNEVSSEPQSTGQETPEAQQASGEQKQQDNTPFHEHPRFKELIEEKNAYRRELDEMKRQLQTMQTPRSEKTQEEKDALIERLKSIDPEFGERFAQLNMTAKELQELKAWKQSMETQTVREKAINSINSLHSEHKVPKEMQDFYNAAIEAEARNNPRMGLQDLPQVYKAVHERFSKYLDTVKRSERESYVKDKTQDAKAPTTQSKGKSVTPNVRKQFSGDEAEQRKETVDEVLKLMRAGKDI